MMGIVNNDKKNRSFFIGANLSKVKLVLASVLIYIATEEGVFFMFV